MYRLHPSWVAVREIVASGRIGRLRVGPELVLLLQRRSDEHPEPARRGRRRAVRHRLLHGEPVADAVRRASRSRSQASMTRDPATGVDITDQRDPRVRRTASRRSPVSTRVETDQRVHIYGSTGRISIGIPFNIPPDRPTAGVRDRRRRSARRAGDRGPDLRRRPTRTPSRPSGSRRRSSTACRPRRRLRTRSRTCASSSGSSQRQWSRRRDLAFVAILPRRSGDTRPVTAVNRRVASGTDPDRAAPRPDGASPPTADR